MTDTLDNNETTDEVSAEELEASESFDLNTICSPATDSIERLLEVYREQVAIVKSFTDKQKSTTGDSSEPTAVVKRTLTEQKKDNANPNVTALKTAGSSFTTAFFEKLPATSSLLSSSILLDELENLVSLMREEYQYHLDAAVQAYKDEHGIKSTPSEKALQAKLACVKLKGDKPNTGLIFARVKMAETLGLDIPSNLYKTGGERNGFNTDIFPRLPKLEAEGSMNSNSTHLVFRFKATGEEEAKPVSETTLNDVGHNVVSNGAYRITGKRIASDLKAKKLGIGATDTEWSLEYKTGTLYGKKA